MFLTLALGFFSDCRKSYRKEAFVGLVRQLDGFHILRSRIRGSSGDQNPCFFLQLDNTE